MPELLKELILCLDEEAPTALALRFDIGFTFHRVAAVVHPNNSIDKRPIDGENKGRESIQTCHVIAEWLFQQLGGSIVFFHEGVLGMSNVSAGIVTSNLFTLNEYTGLFSSTTGDIKGGLEQILVDFTVAMITSGTEKTAVHASVSQNQLVWEYDAQNLWAIYGIAQACTAVSGMTSSGVG
ncbi:hypothetical protein EDD18DRAFT_1108551 [Armillaria luteobubalina]|uniref:Uncharacterized protein n=1 Tax=Armillaria luteobubalina TaxID=153913 RepID=A0AA39PYI3_9AGAR|nr:hypothetical protein EDD18DRAFT_1108551 [Armillaria luteobubalina]